MGLIAFNTIGPILLGLYGVNSIFLIIHEIESAYWKEWELFKMKGGVTVFLLIHFPILAVILYGFMELFQSSIIGMIISIIVSLGGIFAFSIHTYFIRKGHKEFTLPISRFILGSLLVISIIQLALSITMLFFPFLLVTSFW